MRLKDDERRALLALADGRTLKPSKRSDYLLRSFERSGWVRAGELTEKGLRVAVQFAAPAEVTLASHGRTSTPPRVPSDSPAIESAEEIDTEIFEEEKWPDLETRKTDSGKST